jgi:hypothetical protein
LDSPSLSDGIQKDKPSFCNGIIQEMELYEQENGIQTAGAGTTILSDAYNAASTREIQKFMEFLKQGECKQRVTNYVYTS